MSNWALIKKRVAYNITSKKWWAFGTATVLLCLGKITNTIWLYCFYTFCGINVIQKGVEIAGKVLPKITNHNGGGKEQNGGETK